MLTGKQTGNSSDTGPSEEIVRRQVGPAHAVLALCPDIGEQAVIAARQRVFDIVFLGHGSKESGGIQHGDVGAELVHVFEPALDADHVARIGGHVVALVGALGDGAFVDHPVFAPALADGFRRAIT